MNPFLPTLISAFSVSTPLTMKASTPPFTEAESQSWQVSSEFTTALLYDRTLIICTFPKGSYVLRRFLEKDTRFVPPFIAEIIRNSYRPGVPTVFWYCLLYTSDAADE